MLALLGQGETLLLGQLDDRLALCQGVDGLGHNLLVPGNARFLVVHLLGGVDLHVKVGDQAVLGVGIVIVQAGVVVVLHLSGGILRAADVHSSGPALEKAGVPNQQRGHGHSGHHTDHGVEDAVALFLRGLFLRLKLLLGQFLTLHILTDLLFSGCTHVVSFLSFIGCCTAAYFDIIQDSTTGCKDKLPPGGWKTPVFYTLFIFWDERRGCIMPASGRSFDTPAPQFG